MSLDKIKIMFLNSWGESHEDILKRYSRQTPGCSCVWENIIGVSNVDEADFYIMLQNDVNDYPQIPEDKKIYIQREPSYIQQRSWLSKPKLNQFTYDKIYHASTWWLDKTYDELTQLKCTDKTYDVSTIVSTKSHTRGQQLRLNFIYEFIKVSDKLHVYGNGHDSVIGNNISLKGKTQSNCKFDSLKDYRYSLAFENGVIDNYFTEKICDCFLGWCVPIYYGASNISKFFPAGSYYELDISKNSCGTKLENILDQPINKDALREARNLVLNRYNIWPTIKRIINGEQIL
jgi:hypothetical protein